MELADLLSPDSIVDSLVVSSKKQVLQELASRAAALTGIDERTLFDILLERERLGTTGVGKGIAIPHGKVPNLDSLYGLFVRLESPVDFDAIDDHPVDLVFLLLAPESAGADHLKALARVSRLLRDQEICQRLRAAPDDETIFHILTERQSSPAA